jgi:hypothetical protein
VALGLGNVVLLTVNGHWRRAVEGGAVLGSVRAAAIVSRVTGLGAVVAGRWIGFLL